MANELKGTLSQAKNLPTNMNLNPTNIGNFQKVLRDISRSTYEKQAKKDEKYSALEGAGAKPSDVSGGTFSSVMNSLEQLRGGDISKEYAAGVQGYKDTLDAQEKMRQEAKSNETTALENMKRAQDLIAGGSTDPKLYKLAGMDDPNASNLTPADQAIKQALLNGGENLGKPAGTDGFVDPQTYLNAKDAYTKQLGASDPNELINASKDFDNKFGNLLNPDQKDEWAKMGINIPENAKSTAKSYDQYGLLANVPEFNPENKVDQQAKQYIDYYIKNATIPTYYTLFGRAAAGNQTNFSAIQAKAQDLYFKATGQALPDIQILKGNKTLITANNKLLNNLNIQEGTVNQNFKLSIDNIDKNGINQSAPAINSWINYIKDNVIGDPAVAQYLAQNTTVANEMGSLLALKNASGTTVADKLEAAGLVPSNASEEQQKAILKTLMQEAENGRATIKSTTADLYSMIDPLQTDPNNPNRVNQGKTITKSSANDPLNLFP